MDDKEKILRWNLMVAEQEMNIPLPDYDGIMMMGANFNVLEKRRKNLQKCEDELNEYLKNKNS